MYDNSFLCMTGSVWRGYLQVNNVFSALDPSLFAAFIL